MKSIISSQLEKQFSGTSRWQVRKWQPTPVFLPGVSQGRGSLVGFHLWGRTDMTEATLQQQQQTSLSQFHHL